MKKLITLAVFCCAAAIFAADIEIKNSFNNSKIGSAAPLGWRVNGSSPQMGKGEIIQGSEKDEKAFKIVTTSHATAFYRLSPTRAKAGDKVKLSFDVKGKGSGYVGFYTYTGPAGYFPAVDAVKRFNVTAEKQKIEVELVVKDGAKGQKCDNIRFFVAASPRSEVIYEDLELEVDKKD